MARIRSVHPGLATDARFVVLSDSAQIFYVLLLTAADDAGVFRWEPPELRMQLRPASTASVEPLLDELAAGNFLRRFESGGNAYGAVRNFCRFQSPKSPSRRYPLPANLFPYVGAEPDADGPMSSTERSRRHRARNENATKSTVASVAENVAENVARSQSGKKKTKPNQHDESQFPQSFRRASEVLPQAFPTDRERDRDRDKEKEREGLASSNESVAASAEPARPPRPSPSFLEKNQESEAEPRQPLDQIPEGWLAEAEAARDEAGLEPVNLTLEWLKFAMRSDGPVELRRWIEWALRAWVSREPKAYANGTTTADVAETPWDARMRLWHRERWWRTEFGPRPDEPGCFVPPQFLA